MTISSVWRMECDECGMTLSYTGGEIIHGTTVPALERAAYARQWKIEDEADYCPTCVEDLSQ